ncbi:hypothetical protein PsorP6_012980 [Peronosclerospora sorghi]|uniref:Uncharacterized protein n=1 Tax=Peronosclerospora sorghi TaxID=230839 RepID=A0ACC0WHG0_9STRA|nr:hypothetical protein PsorP6_012980 [Peronosclerospora sorghi]
MMEVDEDSLDNMEVDEEGYDSVPTVREQIPSNTDLNLVPVATVNTVQKPIREQLPVERRPQLPPPNEQQQLGYKRELSDAIVFRPPVEGRLVCQVRLLDDLESRREFKVDYADDLSVFKLQVVDGGVVMVTDDRHGAAFF